MLCQHITNFLWLKYLSLRPAPVLARIVDIFRKLSLLGWRLGTKMDRQTVPYAISQKPWAKSYKQYVSIANGDASDTILYLGPEEKRQMGRWQVDSVGPGRQAGKQAGRMILGRRILAKADHQIRLHPQYKHSELNSVSTYSWVLQIFKSYNWRSCHS